MICKGTGGSFDPTSVLKPSVEVVGSEVGWKQFYELGRRCLINCVKWEAPFSPNSLVSFVPPVWHP